MKKVFVLAAVLMLISCQNEESYPLNFNYAGVDIKDQAFFILDANNNPADITNDVPYDIDEFNGSIISRMERDLESVGYEDIRPTIENESQFSYKDVSTGERITVDYIQSGNEIELTNNSETLYRLSDNNQLLEVCTQVSIVEKGAHSTMGFTDYEFDSCRDFNASLQSRIEQYIDSNNAPGDTAYIAFATILFELD